MHLFTLNRQAASAMPIILVASLLFVACQPAVTSDTTPEAKPMVSPLASREAEELKAETAEPAPPVPPIATQTAAPPTEPPPTPTDTPTTVPPTEPPSTPPDVSTDLAFEIRPIEEVSASGPLQIVHIPDTHATLVFESSIPLVCSVVYGKTTAYGLIATDPDMGGGATTDHHPLLLGLKPDTEYHYRVQGTAPDGTLYISHDMAFRTLPAEETAEINLALLEGGARIVAVSSNFGGAANDGPWGANSAIDGNRGTAWSSNGDGNNAFIEIELAQPAKVHAVEVWTRSMSDGTAHIFSFTLTTDAGEVLGPFTLKDARQAYRFEIGDVVARSLRLDVVDSSGGNTGLIEFAVYGTPTSLPASTSSPTPAASGAADADVLHVRAVQAADGSWTFHVTVQHPDADWDDYADGWDVLTPDGVVIKPDPDSPFTRLLLHPHVNEQPFTRSQSGIVIPDDVTQVRVRAHDLVDGFGGREVIVDLTVSSGPDFEVEVIN
jgi:hypothetical protein